MGDPCSRAAQRPPSPLTSAGGPPGILARPVGQCQPHWCRAARFPVPPRETRVSPEQGPPSVARASRAQASRGALGSQRPTPREPSTARATRPGRVSNNTVQPGSSSETTPQPVPSYFPGLRPDPYSALPQLADPSEPTSAHGLSTWEAGLRATLPLRLWAPALCHPRQDQRPGRGTRWTESRGRRDAHTRGLARWPCVPPPGQSASERLPALRTFGGPGDDPFVGELPSPPSLGNHAHTLNSKEVPRGEGEGDG